MPNPTRRALGLLSLLVPARSLLAAEPADAPLALAPLMAAMAAVPERRAAFRETKRLAALSEPLRSTGRLLFRRPGYLEKVTEWPDPERLVVDGDRLVLTAGNEPPRVIDLGGQPELRALVDAVRGPLAGDLDALGRAFAVRAEGTRAAWRLTLAPTDPRAARLLRTVRVDGAGTEVRAVLTVQANGDEQLTSIEPRP